MLHTTQSRKRTLKRRKHIHFNTSAFNTANVSKLNSYHDIVTYLYEKYHANVEARGNEGNAPINTALSRCYLGIDEYINEAFLE